MYHQFSGSHLVRGGGASASRRGKRAATSAQTVVYPFCSTEREAIHCVLFLNDNASRILAGISGGMAPVVSVSCADTLRDIISGSGCGVFEPDSKCRHLPNAKAHHPGFCIDLYTDHSYTSATGVLHVEPAGSYQAQFHWHDGEGRLTLDPVSARLTDLTDRKSISHPFAYHGLPYLLLPVFTAWKEHSRKWSTPAPTTSDPDQPSQASPSLRDMHKVIQAKHLGVRFDGSGGVDPSVESCR
jgi:hypothetical protein